MIYTLSQKKFKIEVKYLKNWKGTSGKYSASKTWKEYQDDFDWLLTEIDNGNKGKVAFIFGWFNCEFACKNSLTRYRKWWTSSCKRE